MLFWSMEQKLSGFSSPFEKCACCFAKWKGVHVGKALEKDEEQILGSLPV